MQPRKACIYGLGIVLMVALATSSWPAETSQKTPTTTQDWGKVRGFVYDAATREPLREALVVVADEGEFATKGKTTGRTDAFGKYVVQGRLGRVTTSVNVGKLLLGAVLGIRIGGTVRESRKIDVSQLNMRVTKEGYKPYEGPVPCRLSDPLAYSVQLMPILLVPEGRAEESGPAGRWGPIRLETVTVEPAILRPGMKAQVIARLAGPAGLLRPAKGSGETTGKSLEVCCLSLPTFWTGPWWRMVHVFPFSTKIKHKGMIQKLTLQRAKEQPAEGIAYTGTFTVPRSAKAADEVLAAAITKAAFDLPEGGEAGISFFQVVTKETERQAAEGRLEAMRLWQAGDVAGARAKIETICAGEAAGPGDFWRLAQFAERLHDYSAAAAAMKRLMQFLPPKDQREFWGEYGRLLLLAGQADKVLTELRPQVEKVPEKSRPTELPIEVMACLGLAYVQSGQLDKAEEILKQTARWTWDGPAPEILREFRRRLRLARAEAAVKAQPNDPQALADYGRLLLDEGRTDEALHYFREALARNPNLPGLQWDLHYALVQAAAGQETKETNFEQALQAAEAAVGTDPQQKPTQDFYAWHRLGVLLYRKGWQQQATGDTAGAAASFKRSRECLTQALKCGRAGSVWTGSLDLTAISGFAFPEADADYLLLEATRLLEKDPDNYLAHFNLAEALLELKIYDLAAQALERCLARRPDYPPARYLQARLAQAKGDHETARRYYEETARRQPWHPDANLRLAEIYTQQGELAEAAACLAAHAAWYGAAPGP